MSGSNGHGGITLAGAIPPPSRIHKTADLSSVDRSTRVDNLVLQVLELTRAHNALNTACRDQFAHLQALVDEQRVLIDAQAGVVLRRSVWQRLRWLLRGA